MFWTIVGAIIFVFWILPMLIGLGLALLGGLLSIFDSKK